jgi:hypothetical protein
LNNAKATYGSGFMVQGMKRQNGISKMESINMGDDKKEKIMIVHGACQGTCMPEDRYLA